MAEAAVAVAVVAMETAEVMAWQRQQLKAEAETI